MQRMNYRRCYCNGPFVGKHFRRGRIALGSRRICGVAKIKAGTGLLWIWWIWLTWRWFLSCDLNAPWARRFVWFLVQWARGVRMTAEG